jgi:formylglycine-generating enzyme required for sulfatase activity
MTHRRPWWTLPLLAAALCLASPTAAKAPPKAGATFHDCASACPEMVVVPPGRFLMGSPPSEPGRDPDEEQQHPVTIGYALAVGKFDVTRDEFAAFAKATSLPDPAKCNIHINGKWPGVNGLNWHNTPFPQTGRHPIVCISWREAKAYAAWLSRKTGHAYRLLSEAEWEYAARAGATAANYWGGDQDRACAYANGVDFSLKDADPNTEVVQHCRDGYAYTSPIGSFKPNAFGLYDMQGDVFQMLEDCYTEGYVGAPTDGSPRLDGKCPCRINRGGSWTSTITGMRAAHRECDDEATTRVVDLGFRVARRLEPGETLR